MFFFFLFLFLFLFSRQQEDCWGLFDYPGTVYNGSCYGVFSSESLKLSQAEANLHCVENFHHNSSLVKVSNEETNTFLDDFRGYVDNLWIGLESQNHVNWYWKGDYSELGWDNWAEGEPSYDGLCVEIGLNGEWNDVDCGVNRRFFCSYEIYACFGVEVNDPSVCSENGKCTYEDVCHCQNECYTGEKCETHHCYGVPYYQDVCSGNGNCSNCDVCECEESLRFFGFECDEFIEDTASLYEDRIVLEYRTSHPIRENCNLIVENLWLYDFSSCEFQYENEQDLEQGPGQTSNLTIWIGEGVNHLLYNGTVIYIFSMSGYHSSIPVFVMLKTAQDEQPPTPGNLINYVIVVVFSSIVIIIVLACIVLVVITFVCLSKNSKRMHSRTSVFEELDNDDFEKANFEIDKAFFTIDFANIEIIEKIGAGAASIVYRGIWNKINVAFKCFRVQDMKEQLFNFFKKEVSLTASMSHPNIVIFYGAVLIPPRVGFVTEFCCNGNLKEFIEKQSLKQSLNQSIDEKFEIESGLEFGEKIKILQGICSAMSYLHKNDIIHRDIKCENVVVNKERVAKLTDFGISRKIEGTDQSQKTVRVGTAYYMAPEVVVSENYDHKCDVFSFSILCYEVICEKFEPYDIKAMNIEVKVSQDPLFRPRLERIGEGECEERIKKLLELCWKHDPGERPEFEQIENTFDTIFELLEKNDETEYSD